IEERLGANPLPIQLPIGAESQFVGVIDLFQMRALVFTDEMGAHPVVEPIPAELMAAAQAARATLVERIAETDEALTNRYLEGQTIANEELYAALRRAVIRNQIVPVLCGSAFRNKGVQPLLDAIVRYLPSPLEVPPVAGINPQTGAQVLRRATVQEPFSALVFKIVTDSFVGRLAYVRVYSGAVKTGDTVLNATRQQRERIGRLIQMQADKRNEISSCGAGDIVALVGLQKSFTGETLCAPAHEILLESIEFPEPVINVAVEARSISEQDKLLAALDKLADEDPTFRMRIDEQSGQTIISGMGELHLEVIAQRLQREFNVQCKVGAPQVALRETITQPVTQEAEYIRQTGGQGHYAVVKLQIEPAAQGAGFTFAQQIAGGALPSEFIQAVQRGVQNALTSGVLASYPVVDIKVTLLDGKFHAVDSHPPDFEVAGGMALREGCRKAGPILLEPYMEVETRAPEEYMGQLVNDFGRRRGEVAELKIMGGGMNAVRCLTPLTEMIGYATDLRSLTSGRGLFTMQFSHYAPAGQAINDRILGTWRRP
ncbi:MAG: elongation factor G, partial [Caldilineaceae bacterium]|nr:elongation factor G [Caldilineaceae bacterium]